MVLVCPAKAAACEDVGHPLTRDVPVTPTFERTVFPAPTSGDSARPQTLFHPTIRVSILTNAPDLHKRVRLTAGSERAGQAAASYPLCGPCI